VFQRQLELAVSLKKPIVIHSREAEKDTVEMMKKLVPKEWNIHVRKTFSGGLENWTDSE